MTFVKKKWFVKEVAFLSCEVKLYFKKENPYLLNYMMHFYKSEIQIEKQSSRGVLQKWRS